MDLAKAAHQSRVRRGLGDQQIDIDHVGGVDDRPGQAAAQGPGRIDRREGANVGHGPAGDVLVEGRDRIGARAALVDRRGDAGMHPGIVGRQAEGRHPFEHMDMQIDPAGSHELAGDVDRLVRLR